MELNTLNDHSSPVSKLTIKFEGTIYPKPFIKIGSSLKEPILNQQQVDDNNDKTIPKYMEQAHDHDPPPPRLKCKVCFKVFKTSSHLAHHKRTHSQTRMKRFKCHLCPKSFPVIRQLHRHSFYTHKEKREGVNYIKCELCPREFFCRSALETHVVQAHVVDKAIECTVCSKKLIDHETLEKHMRKHDKERSHVCDICSKAFTHKQNLITHLGVHHSRFFFCRQCLTSFKNKSEFDAHISDFDSDSNQAKSQCYLCQQVFNSECNLKIHTNSHVKEIKTENQIEPLKTGKLIKLELTATDLNSEKFQCQLCLKTFDREAYFAAHRREVHQHAEWKCNFEDCSKTFKFYNLLNLHKTEHAETKFICNICQKSFPRPDKLKHHQRIHVQDKKYKCELCPNSFGTPSTLKIHVTTKHGGTKPFKCSLVNCGTSWATRGQLNAHLVSHETDKPFKCELCRPLSAFKSLTQLKVHQRRVHSDAKKVEARHLRAMLHSDAIVFACSSNACSFVTASEIEVALHYNEKHELPKVLFFQNFSSSSSSSAETGRMIQKRYKCGTCSKLFEFPSKLSHHLQTHSKEISFKCSLCPKTFKCKQYVDQHVQKVHKKKIKR